VLLAVRLFSFNVCRPSPDHFKRNNSNLFSARLRPVTSPLYNTAHPSNHELGVNRAPLAVSAGVECVLLYGVLSVIHTIAHALNRPFETPGNPTRETKLTGFPRCQRLPAHGAALHARVAIPYRRHVRVTVPCGHLPSSVLHYGAGCLGTAS